MIDLVAAGVAIGLVAGWLLRGKFDRREGRDDVEAFLEEKISEVQLRYQTTTVDDEEQLGYELLVLQDPGTERIMRSVVDVDGVGPETALEVARHFEADYAAFAMADVEDLQEVNGVGEQRSRALASRG